MPKVEIDGQQYELDILDYSEADYLDTLMDMCLKYGHV